MTRSLLFCVWLDGYLKAKKDISLYDIDIIYSNLTNVLNKEVSFEKDKGPENADI